MSESVTTAWLEQYFKRAALVPVLILHTPMGDRVYGEYYPSDGWAFDAPVIDRGARLLRVSPLGQSAEPIGQVVIGSWTQAELPHATVELDNTDKGMSKFIGQEFILGLDAEVYMTFEGLGPADSLRKVTGQIRQWRLTQHALALEIVRL